jgi:glutamate-1-semialdehyde 2,1-aminomutase
MAKRVAALVPGYAYDEARFFGADDAPPEVQARRVRLCGAWPPAQCPAREIHCADPAGARAHSRPAVHRRYRVPFQFSPYLRQHLAVGAFVQRTDGVMLTDLDGRVLRPDRLLRRQRLRQRLLQSCIAEGSARVADLGPCWAATTRWWQQRRAQLCRISGLDEVSFHMSGTEAVMQAVRLARYHTRRKYLVRFSGAYHGWWEDVQPGPGNPLPPGHTYTLKEMDADTLRVLRKRRDIACVLVNPLQALHPNRRRRATARWSTAAAAHTSTVPPTPPGCSSCARCAASAASR